MNVTLLTHIFYPEIGAPSARWFETAKFLAEKGHNVSVVTCFPNHPTGIIPVEYKGKKFLKEEVDGVTIYRNYVYATPNKGFFKRVIGHLSFVFSSVLLSAYRVPKPDVIVVTSPAFLTVFSGYLFHIMRRAPFIFEVRDLWPDAVVKLGVLKNKIIIKVLEWFELFFYRKSKRVVVVTNSFRKQIAERGIAEEKIEVITNGVDFKLFNLNNHTGGERIRNEYGWGNKQILLYAGAHGISQGLQTIIEVAKKLRREKNIQFVFVGEGAEKEMLQDLVVKYDLHNVEFLPGQPKYRMPDFYAAADLCFVPLRNIPMFKAYIPSKIFEILGCGCPIVASLSGEAAEILKQSGGAKVVEPENAEQIYRAVRSLLEDASARRRMGQAGHEFVKKFYSREALANRYEQVLENTVRGK